MDFLSELRDINIPESIIEQIANHFGGNPVYVPKRKKDIATRNTQIYSEFNGKNHIYLCRKHNLSYQQVCRIIAKNRIRSI